MRKTPVYTLKGGLGEWLEKNSEIMYTEVLESIEAAIAEENSLTAVPVIILQSDGGTTLFILKSYEATEESLEKAMNWFVSVEEYEKAARARDAKQLVASLKNLDDCQE